MDRLTDEEVVELWNERAAIMEFDGRLARADAERRAYCQVKRVHRPNSKMPEETAVWSKRLRVES